jgi:hypothetical protein
MVKELEILLKRLSEFSALTYTQVRGMVYFGPLWSWNELDSNGQSAQHDLHCFYEKFVELATNLLKDRVPLKLKSFEERTQILRSFIQQEESQWNGIDELYSQARTALREQEEILHLLCPPAESDSSTTTSILVPDTNALIGCPLLERFQFDWPQVEVILVPTVISELDNLKVQARSSEMRDKVKKVITQIKEMRRRGHLTNGVKVNSKMSLRTIAVEPSQGTALSWLDFENLDDRIVASVMEVTRENLDQVVILVTADLNLQTKAEFARIPYLEPPDPT